MSDWLKIEQSISDVSGNAFSIKKKSAVSGGDINQAFRLSGRFENEQEDTSLFIKLNHKNRLDMFTAEAEGLEEIARADVIRVPRVIVFGIEGNQSYLVMEDLSFGGSKADSAKRLGQQLAAMHRVSASQFGWSRDNTIGSTPQQNSFTSDWITFWREHRLGYQLQLAKQNGCSQSLYKNGQELQESLDKFFITYSPQASLLHGDLWSGNYAYMNNGDPVIYDPAVYYGDRETDIAMTELFGGFPADFYTAYQQAWPLDEGYQQRKTLYNLYHILNHYNLFGGGYAQQAQSMIEKLLA